jgi:hypothetical protein
MRVLVGPRIDLEREEVAAAAARALAGPEGIVLSLRHVGVNNFARPWTAAEVASLREAMRGDEASGNERAEVVGYVCRGTCVGSEGGAPGRSAVGVLVADHANLTWRSPLTGPNDDSAGPRFPSMTGIYAPDIAADRLGAAEGMIVVVSGVVAGVRDDGALSAFEAGVVASQGYVAASSELVPAVIVAAHMGLRVAAVVMAGSRQEGDG